MAATDDEDELRNLRDLLDAHRQGGFSRVEIERIVDDRAERKLNEKLRALGFDPEKPAETAAIVGSVKNLRRGIMTFIFGVVGAAALSAWAYFQAHLSGGGRP